MQPKVFSLIDKAICEFDMILSGSRILVGASGGKDSTLLIEYLANRKKRTDFFMEAVYIKTDFAENFDENLYKIMHDWGIDVKTIEIDTLARVKAGKKMNCWWCSTQRRAALLDYATKNGFDTLALGHHLDDILETFLMNAVEKGVLSTMLPRFSYDRYPLKIIRPLAYCPVEEIVAHAKTEGWQSATCTCTYQDNSGRKAARAKLSALTADDEKSKWRLFSALKNAGLLA